MFERQNFAKESARKLWTGAERRRVPVTPDEIAAIQGAGDPKQALADLYRTRLRNRGEG